MLKYNLIKETDKTVLYKYFPEGESDSGVVAFDKQSGSCSIDTLADNDRHKIYALKLFKRIREFASKGTFEKEGTVAWY